MKAVLMSIQPKFCELIASGKKTVEVRKTKPKLDVPFKVYIYCTKGKPTFTQSAFCDEVSNGKVVGEFVCNAIISHCEMANADIAEIQGCIKREKLLEYSNGKELFGWHITDLIIYDKPKELGEFKTFCKSYYDGKRCDECKYFIDGRGYEYDESDCGCNGLKPITRPPQSWCYVEEGR